MTYTWTRTVWIKWEVFNVKVCGTYTNHFPLGLFNTAPLFSREDEGEESRFPVISLFTYQNTRCQFRRRRYDFGFNYLRLLFTYQRMIELFANNDFERK